MSEMSINKQILHRLKKKFSHPDYKTTNPFRLIEIMYRWIVNSFVLNFVTDDMGKNVHFKNIMNLDWFKTKAWLIKQEFKLINYKIGRWTTLLWFQQ